MLSKVHVRDVQYVVQPVDWEKFQDMCVHVYGEVYCSPGACLYGRGGQAQHGLDILFKDFRAAPVDKRKGVVFVQCKYSASQGGLNFSVVKDDLISARDLVRDSEAYKGVYLYILATNAKNDVAMHDYLSGLKVELNLPFDVEFHAWDKIGSMVQSNSKLWELFSNQPGEGVPTDLTVQVHQWTVRLKSKLSFSLLLDARDIDMWRQKLKTGPGFGDYETPIPLDIWKSSGALRKALIELYSQAADSPSAIRLLKFELNLSGMSRADVFLDYLVAARIVGNLRSPTARFPLVGDKPQFTEWLSEFSELLYKTQGAPDKVACLALLLIMESDDRVIQDRALVMMTEMVERDRGTIWEFTARAAHSVVRYYYVIRRGWSPLACFYALGDSLGWREVVNQFSDLLDAPFCNPNKLSLKVFGMDPLQVPRYGWGGLLMISSLSKMIFGENFSEFLPSLKAQCRIYSSYDYESEGPVWDDAKLQISERRVVGFSTLALVAGKGKTKEFLERYVVVVTEKTFEQVLGYRAYLRAYVERVGEAAGKYLEKLHRIERLVQCFRLAPQKNHLSKGNVWVLPVYDNPPPRLNSNLLGDTMYSRSFTLSHERQDYWRQDNIRIMNHEGFYSKLESQYTQRDELSLCFLLALHLQVPMIASDYNEHMYAARMGVAADYPHFIRSNL